MRRDVTRDSNAVTIDMSPRTGESESSDSDGELERLLSKRRQKTSSLQKDATPRANVGTASTKHVTAATVHAPAAGDTTPVRRDTTLSDASVPTTPLLMSPAHSSEMLSMQVINRAPSAFKVVTPGSSQPNTRPSSRGSAKSSSNC